jgi:hypothetical protein
MRKGSGNVCDKWNICGSSQDYLDRGLLLTRKLLTQWFLFVKLKSSHRKLFATSGTYSWSFVTQIFHNGQPSHGGDRKTFELFVLLSLFWPLCCLFFFDLRILITTLVSSNSSCQFLWIVHSWSLLRISLTFVQLYVKLINTEYI